MLISYLSVHDLGRAVKDAVQKQGMLGWQYNTIGVSDAITMGGEGLYNPWLFFRESCDD
jgi:dihydroxyacid dehydratase/phosphogluconate dehydratase